MVFIQPSDTSILHYTRCVECSAWQRGYISSADSIGINEDKIKAYNKNGYKIRILKYNKRLKI